MSVYGDMLVYMKNEYTYSQLVDITGVPQTTLWNVINDRRILPYQYEPNVRYTYAQTSYNNLIGHGANKSQAMMQMNDIPKNVMSYEQRWESVANNIARFRAGRYILAGGDFPTGQSWDQLVASYLPGAKQSMSKMFNTLDQAESFDFESPERVYL